MAAGKPLPCSKPFTTILQPQWRETNMQCDCEMENCKSAKTHKVGACRETPAVKITIFGLKENLCERCFYQVKDRKSTRLNSSHSQISYAVFCLKKKQKM